MVQKAADQSLVFQDRNYRDLGSFAGAVVKRLSGPVHRYAKQIKIAAEALCEHLAERGP